MTQSLDLLRVLINDAALHLVPELVVIPDNAQVIIAGSSLVRMTLAELALPGAETVWTDFRHSASVSALHGAVLAAGGLDRMILAADGERTEAMFALMSAVLTFRPALRRRSGARVELVVEKGRAVSSLIQFTDRLRPKLKADGISLSMQVVERRPDRIAA